MQPSITNELSESISQFEGAWRTMGRDFPGAEFTRIPGLSISWPDVPLVFFNAAFVTGEVRDEAELRQRAQRALAYMKTRRQPGFLVVCEDMLAQGLREAAAAVLAGENFHPAMPITGMAASELALVTRPVEGVEMRRASGRADAELITDLNCRAYGVPVEIGCSSISEMLTSDACHAYILQAGDRPVACAVTFPLEQRLYVAFVATLPEQQRRGYAEAVMRASLESCAAASGLTRTILHATDAGRPVYRRMGYHDTAKFMLYSQPMPEH